MVVRPTRFPRQQWPLRRTINGDLSIVFQSDRAKDLSAPLYSRSFPVIMPPNLQASARQQTSVFRKFMQIHLLCDWYMPRNIFHLKKEPPPPLSKDKNDISIPEFVTFTLGRMLLTWALDPNYRSSEMLTGIWQTHQMLVQSYQAYHAMYDLGCCIVDGYYCCVVDTFFFFSAGLWYVLHVSRSSVGFATDYGLDGPESESRWGEIFRPSRPALGPTQPPAQRLPG